MTHPEIKGGRCGQRSSSRIVQDGFGGEAIPGCGFDDQPGWIGFGFPAGQAQRQMAGVIPGGITKEGYSSDIAGIWLRYGYDIATL